MTVDEKEKDDVTWAADRLWDTYKRHCEKNGDEYIPYEDFKRNLFKAHEAEYVFDLIVTGKI
jgi:hypothetical protein